MNEAAAATPEEPTEQELVTSRHLAAPPGRIFDAWVDPARLARWWGPAGFCNTFEVCEPRTGGAWRFTMHGPDGASYANECTFLAVERPLRVVVRHVSPPRFDLIATFAEEGTGTRLTWRQRFESADVCARVRGVCVPANEQNLDRLEAELERG